MTVYDYIKRAKSLVGTDNELAAFMLRDLPETRAAGLQELAWDLAIPRTGYTSDGDIEYLIGQLGESLSKEAK